MRLAFSTLSCPAWDIERILAEAVASGYDGVELRGYQGEMDLPRAAPFTPENREATRRRFEGAGVAFCCIGSSGIVAKGNVEHVEENAALARDLGAPYVRIFGGTPESRTEAVENLRAFGDAARSEGVALVLETHDDFSTGATVSSLLAEAAHPAVFSLWDMHHPYRQGEPPAETLACLGPTLRHVHVKDGTVERGYLLLGEGDIPNESMLDSLQTFGYDGFVSVEWEKRWHPEIEDPSVALPQYAQKLRSFRLSG